MMTAMNKELTLNNTSASSLLFSTLNNTEESDIEEDVCRNPINHNIRQATQVKVHSPSVHGDTNNINTTKHTNHTKEFQQESHPTFGQDNEHHHEYEHEHEHENNNDSSPSTVDTVLQYLVGDNGNKNKNIHGSSFQDVDETHPYGDISHRMEYEAYSDGDGEGDKIEV